MSTQADTSEKPLRRDAERNRQRIMAAARELFAQRGLEVTMDDIAHHAGVGVGTVYRRFPDRELLIDALFEDTLARMVTLAEEGLQKDPWEGFVYFLTGALEMQTANRGLKGLLFSTAHGRERVADARARIDPVASQLVARAKASGDLRPDITDTDMPLLSLSLGTTDDFAGHIEPGIWRRYLGILLDGLRTRRDAPTKLEVEPMADVELDRAMRTWRPPGR
jgi:AcrR family transcriptional regulator